MAQKFDVARLINRFGGRTRLYERLRERGHDISIKAIEKWRERGRISQDWLAELIVMAAEEGNPLDLQAYLVRSTDQPTEQPKTENVDVLA